MKRAVAIWAICGVLLAFADVWLFAHLWILTFGIWLVFWAIGPGLLVVGLFRAYRMGWSRHAIALALSPLLFFVGLAFFGGHLGYAGDAAIFRLRWTYLRPRYEGLVPILEREAAAESGEQRGVRYVVDLGPPLRIAFPQPGGIIDNWEAVIYDPSGAVGQARGWAGAAGEFSAPPAVRELFGGDLLACRHIEGPYYRCWFT